MASKRIPLVGSVSHRALSISTALDQQFINCFPEVNKNAVTGAGSAYLYKRPGTVGTNCAGASYIGTPGSVVWSGFSTGAKGAFCYLNGTTLQVWDTNRVQIGGDPTAHTTGFTRWTRLSETLVSGVANLVLLAKESATGVPYGWVYPEGGAWARITAADFPANTPARTLVGNAVHMDGYMFVMDSRGTIWNSDLNSVTAWTATSFIDAQIYPDGGLGLAKSRNMVVGFGTQSVEFFQNAGNVTGSPLTRIASAAVKVGALGGGFQDGETIKTIGDNVFFVGVNSDTGSIGFYMIDGVSVKKISTAAIDRYLQYTQLNGITAAIAGGMTMHGMRHVVLSASINSTVGTPCYCIDTNTWWTLTLAAGGAQSNSQVTACIGLAGEGYFTTYLNGNSQGRKLHVTAQSTLGYTDNDGTSYEMRVQTNPEDYGSDRRKFFTRLTLVADTEGGGDMNVSYSDDDYTTFSTPRAIAMTSGQKTLTRLGSGRQRIWRLSNTSAFKFRGRFLDVEYQEGAT